MLRSFSKCYGEKEIDSINTEEVITFLNDPTTKNGQSTKYLRYSHLKAFFNFCINGFNLKVKNPCNNSILRKMYRMPKLPRKRYIDKETIDEMIFRTENARNRLILELQARGGLRIGEVLKFTPKCVDGRKLILEKPKSGREYEVAFIPQRVAERLKEYIAQKRIQPNEKIFPLTYSGARHVVKKAATKLVIDISPHDLRRHSATYASRNGIPLEIISKIILRHSDLSTTQRYLGKIDDSEATRWIETLYG